VVPRTLRNRRNRREDLDEGPLETIESREGVSLGSPAESRILPAELGDADGARSMGQIVLVYSIHVPRITIQFRLTLALVSMPTVS
jgi:hypothetical protein